MLDGLREKLLHPELIAAFVEEYPKAFNAAPRVRSSTQDNARRELKQIERKTAGIIAAIGDGIRSPIARGRGAKSCRGRPAVARDPSRRPLT